MDCRGAIADWQKFLEGARNGAFIHTTIFAAGSERKGLFRTGRAKGVAEVVVAVLVAALSATAAAGRRASP